MATPYRNSGVDLARSIALLGVILVHTTGIGFGRFGVQIFFLVSGFLLANYRLYESNFEFILHRFFRLFPLYLLFSIFYYTFQNYDFRIIHLTLMANIGWTFNQIPGGWSISNEWIYSLFLITLGALTKKKTLSLLTLCLASQLVTGFWVWNKGGADIENVERYQFLTWINTTNPVINLSFFLIGLAIKTYLHNSVLPTYILVITVALAIAVDTFLGHVMFIWNFGVLSTFLLCLQLKMPNFLITICGYIGKRTYGIFFTHFVVMSYVSSLLSNFTSLIGAVYEIVYFSVTFVLSLVGGAITWKLIEHPSLQLYKNIQKSKKFGSL
jgi:peptidoglycan/LPS O-acetylase OafA/YrhL